MLIKSKYCYMEASTCQTDEVFEEEWLHHYMLGKIAEKSGEEPDKYLYHYKKVWGLIVLAKCVKSAFFSSSNHHNLTLYTHHVSIYNLNEWINLPLFFATIVELTLP